MDTIRLTKTDANQLKVLLGVAARLPIPPAGLAASHWNLDRFAEIYDSINAQMAAQRPPTPDEKEDLIEVLANLAQRERTSVSDKVIQFLRTRLFTGDFYSTLRARLSETDPILQCAVCKKRFEQRGSLMVSLGGSVVTCLGCASETMHLKLFTTCKHASCGDVNVVGKWLSRLLFDCGRHVSRKKKKKVVNPTLTLTPSGGIANALQSLNWNTTSWVSSALAPPPASLEPVRFSPFDEGGLDDGDEY
jgi:hypothetical protein